MRRNAQLISDYVFRVVSDLEETLPQDIQHQLAKECLGYRPQRFLVLTTSQQMCLDEPLKAPLPKSLNSVTATVLAVGGVLDGAQKRQSAALMVGRELQVATCFGAVTKMQGFKGSMIVELSQATPVRSSFQSPHNQQSYLLVDHKHEDQSLDDAKDHPDLFVPLRDIARYLTSSQILVVRGLIKTFDDSSFTIADNSGELLRVVCAAVHKLPILKVPFALFHAFSTISHSFLL